MIKKIIKGKTKNNSDDKILKPYFTIKHTDKIPIKDIYVCMVVSSYPDPTKIQTVMENALFVKKNNSTYIHIASGKEIATLDSVENFPTMFAVKNIRLFSDIFKDYIEANNLDLNFKLAVEEISKIENDGTTVTV